MAITSATVYGVGVVETRTVRATPPRGRIRKSDTHRRPRKFSRVKVRQDTDVRPIGMPPFRF